MIPVLGGFVGRRILILLVCAAAVWAAGVQGALAFREGDATFAGDDWDCALCHKDSPYTARTGPHGDYVATSSKCKACHAVHSATGYALLPEQTTRDNCMVCHDGTGGYGVYGTLAARGVAVGASHRIDTTSVVPGGSLTGGATSLTFTGENGFLSCEDCHSVHGAEVVEPFRGDRVRFHVTDPLALETGWSTTKLLRQQPRGSASSTPVYGSDWCLGCHRGRSPEVAAVMNHAVDCSATNADPFYYDRIAAVTTETSLLTTITTLGRQGSVPTMTFSNRGFVMPSPRTAEQAGHAPICQQCHEDSRAVGEPGDVEHAQVTGYGDGNTATDNPRFQTFPHETENPSMLVETYDDLCTNCHPVSSLP